MKEIVDQCLGETDSEETEPIETGTRARSYLLTLNNWTSEEYDQFVEYASKPNIKYSCCASEVAPTTGTPHLHWYFRAKEAICWTTIKRAFPRSRIDTCMGNDQQNYEYLRKYEKGSPTQELEWEVGKKSEQGKRKDVERIRHLCNKGANIREIVSIASSCQSVRFAEIHLKYLEKKRNWKPEVKWYWGATGTGKSFAAYAECKDPFSCLATAQWWEGYDQHEEVIIDDMRGSFCQLNVLLKILDRYPLMIECKGGSRQLLAKKIIITSCYHPQEIYHATDENISQLLDRIDEIVEFKGDSLRSKSKISTRSIENQKKVI